MLTTASDSRETIGVDLLGRELGWTFEATHDELVRASAAVVNDDPVALVQEAGSRHWWTRSTPLPANVELLDRFDQVQPQRHRSVLWITHAELDADFWQQWAERLVVYRPPAGQLPDERGQHA